MFRGSVHIAADPWWQTRQHQLRLFEKPSYHEHVSDVYVDWEGSQRHIGNVGIHASEVAPRLLECASEPDIVHCMQNAAIARGLTDESNLLSTICRLLAKD